ncbi:unnamed protein product [Ectocarpus sp. 12 AP-2014]
MQTQTSSVNLSSDKFLTMSVNLLNRAFLENSRTEAKKLFRQLEEGKTMAITHLQMEDKSMVRVDVALNHKFFPGKLNFRTFKTALTLLLSNAAETLKKPEDLRTYRNEVDPNSVLFGVTAVVIEDNVPSVLALGAETGRGGPNFLLQLSYLDPKQFETDAAGADQSTV